MAYLTISTCVHIAYAVLPSVSRRYPPSEARFLIFYSPVRHSVPKDCVRLACIRHAASVHPEPGSNSSSFVLLTLYVFNSSSSDKLSDVSFCLETLRFWRDFLCLSGLCFSFQCSSAVFLTARLVYHRTLSSVKKFLKKVFFTFLHLPSFFDCFAIIASFASFVKLFLKFFEISCYYSPIEEGEKTCQEEN